MDSISENFSDFSNPSKETCVINACFQTINLKPRFAQITDCCNLSLPHPINLSLNLKVNEFKTHNGISLGAMK
jgi:hypothetical protein